MCISCDSSRTRSLSNLAKWCVYTLPSQVWPWNTAPWEPGRPSPRLVQKQPGLNDLSSATPWLWLCGYESLRSALNSMGENTGLSRVPQTMVCPSWALSTGQGWVLRLFCVLMNTIAHVWHFQKLYLETTEHFSVFPLGFPPTRPHLLKIVVKYTWQKHNNLPF